MSCPVRDRTQKRLGALDTSLGVLLCSFDVPSAAGPLPASWASIPGSRAAPPVSWAEPSGLWDLVAERSTAQRHGVVLGFKADRA